MTTFWALFALVHWFDPHGTFRPGACAAINSVPFAVYAAVGLVFQGPRTAAPTG
jgi:hypothetical protein